MTAKDTIVEAIGNSNHIKISDNDVVLVTWNAVVTLASFDDESVTIVPSLPVGVSSRRQVRRFINRLGNAGVTIPVEVALDLARHEIPW